jgi:hypothetical protein
MPVVSMSTLRRGEARGPIRAPLARHSPTIKPQRKRRDDDVEIPQILEHAGLDHREQRGTVDLNAQTNTWSRSLGPLARGPRPALC